jgi:hypothetical protein
VNAQFFALAFTAAQNPKLLALDLLLIENRRPRVMFAGILAGGLGVAVAIDLVDVLVVQASGVKSQGEISAGVDLAVGLVLVFLGALLLAGVLPRRRQAPAPSGQGAAERGEAEAGRLGAIVTVQLAARWFALARCVMCGCSLGAGAAEAALS